MGGQDPTVVKIGYSLPRVFTTQIQCSFGTYFWEMYTFEFGWTAAEYGTVSWVFNFTQFFAFIALGLIFNYLIDDDSASSKDIKKRTDRNNHFLKYTKYIEVAAVMIHSLYLPVKWHNTIPKPISSTIASGFPTKLLNHAPKPPFQSAGCFNVGFYNVLLRRLIAMKRFMGTRAFCVYCLVFFHGVGMCSFELCNKAMTAYLYPKLEITLKTGTQAGSGNVKVEFGKTASDSNNTKRGKLINLMVFFFCGANYFIIFLFSLIRYYIQFRPRLAETFLLISILFLFHQIPICAIFFVTTKSPRDDVEAADQSITLDFTTTRSSATDANGDITASANQGTLTTDVSPATFTSSSGVTLNTSGTLKFTKTQPSGSTSQTVTLGNNITYTSGGTTIHVNAIATAASAITVSGVTDTAPQAVTLSDFNIEITVTDTNANKVATRSGTLTNGDDYTITVTLAPGTRTKGNPVTFTLVPSGIFNTTSTSNTQATITIPLTVPLANNDTANIEDWGKVICLTIFSCTTMFWIFTGGPLTFYLSTKMLGGHKIIQSFGVLTILVGFTGSSVIFTALLENNPQIGSKKVADVVFVKDNQKIIMSVLIGCQFFTFLVLFSYKYFWNCSNWFSYFLLILTGVVNSMVFTFFNIMLDNDVKGKRGKWMMSGVFFAVTNAFVSFAMYIMFKSFAADEIRRFCGFNFHYCFPVVYKTMTVMFIILNAIAASVYFNIS